MLAKKMMKILMAPIALTENRAILSSDLRQLAFLAIKVNCPEHSN